MNTGIICELNPFHGGHKYLFDNVRQGGKIICVMSGNFVQRGDFAVFDKFARTKAALDGGADLVIELPAAYSLRSAEGFARAGVDILEKTGVVDRIAFGSESGDISSLKAAAEKAQACIEEIKLEMKSGISFPAARRAVTECELFDYPNNTLAIEYLKFASLPAVTVKRIGKGHDSDDCEYSSSQIRNRLEANEICTMKSCERAVLSALRKMSAEDFLQIDDVTDGLENRITQAVRASASLEEAYDRIKTKRYTLSRIRRIILKSYLGITKKYDADVPYIRILGFNSGGREILAEMKEKCSLPTVSKYGDAEKIGGFAKELFELECRCTDLYNLGYKNPLPCGTEQRSKIVITD